MNQTLKDNIKALIPMNTIRNLRAVRNARSIRHMADIPRIPFDKTAYPEGINMIGCFTQDSGLGESCRIVAREIEASGISHQFIDLSKYEWIGSDHSFDDKVLDSTDSEAFRYGINLWHVNMHFFEKAWELCRDKWDQHYNIAFWLWENENFPEEWIPMLHMLDEIWTPSEFTSNSIRRITKKPVVTVPYTVEVHPAENIGREYFQLPEDKFLYLMLYDANSISDRKNPEGVIRAFKEAFPIREQSASNYEANNKTQSFDMDQVGLVIKISHASEAKLSQLRSQLAGYHVYFIRDMLPKPYVEALIQCCDAYISLHRAEGYGLVLGEAMALGVPTIATNYSGNLEFQNEANAALVDARKIRIGKDIWPYKAEYEWADPDIEDAARKIREIYMNKNYREAIIKTAKEFVREDKQRQQAVEIIRARMKIY